MCIRVALKENVRLARILQLQKEVCSNQGFLPGLQKNCQEQKPRGILMPKRYLHGPMTWEVMQRNVWKDIANLRMKETEQSYKVATPCMDDHQFREEENGSAGETCSCGNDMDKKLVTNVWQRMISYKHHTCEHRQYCYVGNHSTTMPVHFRKSHIRTNKLDVQETEFSFTQFCGS